MVGSRASLYFCFHFPAKKHVIGFSANIKIMERGGCLGMLTLFDLFDLLDQGGYPC